MALPKPAGELGVHWLSMNNEQLLSVSSTRYSLYSVVGHVEWLFYLVSGPHKMMVRPSAVEDDNDFFRWTAAGCGSGGGF